MDSPGEESRSLAIELNLNDLVTTVLLIAVAQAGWSGHLMPGAEMSRPQLEIVS